MVYFASPTFPVSTSTSFDDLTLIKDGDLFVIRGYEYRAHSDAEVTRRNGIETVSIDAMRRRHPKMLLGWEMVDVRETRAYVETLDDICDA